MQRGNQSALAATVSIVVGLTGCGPGQHDAFTMPIPPETEVIEHLPVSDAERRGRAIAARRELVISGTGPEAEEIFLQVTDLAVDASGSIYVYDAGRFTVEEFTSEGAHVHTYGGREGQGPGDLGSSGQIAVVADRLMYVEASRFNTWDLGTRSLSAAGRLPGSRVRHAHGTDSGEVVVAFGRSLPGGEVGWGITSFDTDGTQLAQYAVLQQPGFIYLEHRDVGSWTSINTWISRGEADVVVARSSEVYLTQGDRYEVLSLDVDGSARWALRVDWPREALTETDIERGKADAAAGGSDIRGYTADWPDLMPALSVLENRQGTRGHPIRVDGHGNLYVFPFVRGAPEQRLVDVYSADGERLFAGVMPNVSWVASRGDHLYGIETGPSGDQRVVRYRLELPFR
jgi:hypothetical protein